MKCNANLKQSKGFGQGSFKLSFFLDRKNVKKRYTPLFFHSPNTTITKKSSLHSNNPAGSRAVGRFAVEHLWNLKTQRSIDYGQQFFKQTM